jgi:hypothetical protein
MNHPSLSAALAAAALLASCAAPSAYQPDPLTEVEIIQMARNGMSADAIIDSIRSSGTVYILDTRDVVRLHQAGVPDPVIDYMQKTRMWDLENRARTQPYHHHHPHHLHPYCHDPYCHGPHWHAGFGWYWW